MSAVRERIGKRLHLFLYSLIVRQVSVTFPFVRDSLSECVEGMQDHSSRLGKHLPAKHDLDVFSWLAIELGEIIRRAGKRNILLNGTRDGFCFFQCQPVVLHFESEIVQEFQNDFLADAFFFRHNIVSLQCADYITPLHERLGLLALGCLPVEGLLNVVGATLQNIRGLFYTLA